MAKSKRSAVKRRFRAVKRHKVKPKTVVLLKKVLNMPIGGTGLPYVDASRADLPEVTPMVKPLDTNCRKKKPPLMNEHGNYPVWMNKKDMRRHINRRKRIRRNKRKTLRNGN